MKKDNFKIRFFRYMYYKTKDLRFKIARDNAIDNLYGPSQLADVLMKLEGKYRLPYKYNFWGNLWGFI
jgi:hypothetical protein